MTDQWQQDYARALERHAAAVRELEQARRELARLRGEYYRAHPELAQ